jgi:uncharacterized damage-inducible protein DinB
MDTVAAALLTSWDRQVEILGNIIGLIDEKTRGAKPAPEGWPIAEHLAHIHEVRYGWLNEVAPELAKTLGDTYIRQGDTWVPITDLAEIKSQLDLSAKAIRVAVEEALASGKTQVGPYSSPVFFLQHMIWHEGYHFGLIVLALRNAGAEPTEEWDEEKVWAIWRS